MQVLRSKDSASDASFVLDCEDLTLTVLELDGAPLAADRWVRDEKNDSLEIKGPLPDKFTVRTVATVLPHENTQLSGLYKSSGVWCTQCEAEGFRRIAPMQDRPDIMCLYKVPRPAPRAPRPALRTRAGASQAARARAGRCGWRRPRRCAPCCCPTATSRPPGRSQATPRGTMSSDTPPRHRQRAAPRLPGL
jgi:aminopeptidase N